MRTAREWDEVKRERVERAIEEYLAKAPYLASVDSSKLASLVLDTIAEAELDERIEEAELNVALTPKEAN